MFINLKCFPVRTRWVQRAPHWQDYCAQHVEGTVECTTTMSMPLAILIMKLRHTMSPNITRGAINPKEGQLKC